MPPTKTDKNAREAAYLGAHAAAFMASEHLTGRARIGGLSAAAARAQQDTACQEMERIQAGMKPIA